MSLENKVNKQLSKLKKRALDQLNKRLDNEFHDTSKSIILEQRDIDLYKIELELQNAELLETQSKLNTILDEYTEFFDMAPIGYFILDKVGVIKNVNISGTKSLGLTKKQIIGKYFSTFIESKECQDRFYIHQNQVLETGKKQQFECKLNSEKTNEYFALIQTVIIKDTSKNFKHFLLTLSCINNQKEHEQSLERALNKEKKLNDMKSQFIAIASHEFRTPLAAILTSTELIERYNRPEDEEKKQNHFRRINGSVHRIKEILTDFLSENEIANGKIKNTPEKFHIKSFIENLINENMSSSTNHKIAYTHLGLESDIYLDKKILKTSLINLLINAYKYSPKAELIEVISHQCENHITFSVRDFGIGIPENDQEMLFEPFFRAKNAENIQGTGLGLNITKRLIQIMGGTIDYETKENEGTIFTIIIPLL